MKATTLILALAFALGLGLRLVSSAAGETISGQLSDSMCAAKHEDPAEGGPELTPEECTNACVRGGSQYVLVADGNGKVLKIANQDHVALETLAGSTVVVTGELEGDTLTIASVKPSDN